VLHKIFILLTPLIQPLEIFAMPKECILRLEDPVILVREDEQA
jgi:hypothetical protein